MGRMPVPRFPRRLGQQLLQPSAEAADRRRQDEGDLVASLPGGNAEQEAESDPRVPRGRHVGRARFRHPLGGRQQPADVEAHRDSRHHPERRERGEAPADARHASEDGAKPRRRCPVVERRPRIGDGDEPGAGRFGADPLRHPREEVAFEEMRLERRAGLARHLEQRARDIQPALERTDLGRVGGIEDAKIRRPGHAPERLPQHLGAEAGAAHTEQADVGEALRGYRGAEPAQTIEVGPHPLRRFQPAQPPVLPGAGPERRVPAPEASRAVPTPPVGDRVRRRRAQCRRQPSAVLPRRLVSGHRRSAGARATVTSLRHPCVGDWTRRLTIARPLRRVLRCMSRCSSAYCTSSHARARTQITDRQHPVLVPVANKP